MSEVTKLIRSLSPEQLDIITKALEAIAERYRRGLDKKLREIHEVLESNKEIDDKFFSVFLLMNDAERYYVAYDVCQEAKDNIVEVWTGDRETLEEW